MSAESCSEGLARTASAALSPVKPAASLVAPGPADATLALADGPAAVSKADSKAGAGVLAAATNAEAMPPSAVELFNASPHVSADALARLAQATARVQTACLYRCPGDADGDTDRAWDGLTAALCVGMGRHGRVIDSTALIAFVRRVRALEGPLRGVQHPEQRAACLSALGWTAGGGDAWLTKLLGTLNNVADLADALADVGPPSVVAARPTRPTNNTMLVTATYSFVLPFAVRARSLVSIPAPAD